MIREDIGDIIVNNIRVSERRWEEDIRFCFMFGFCNLGFFFLNLVIWFILVYLVFIYEDNDVNRFYFEDRDS